MGKMQNPKKTEEVRAKLDSFAGLQRKIDNQIERLEALISTMDSPSSPNLTGLPGGGFDGVSKTERLVIKKIELEDKIRKLEAKEASLRAEIEQLIEQLKREMKNAARLLEFEHAAYLRDRIKELER